MMDAFMKGLGLLVTKNLPSERRKTFRNTGD